MEPRSRKRKAIKPQTERGSAARLILLLKLIAQHGEAFSLKDLSARAGLPQASVHRLLQALVRSGMIERGAHQSYRPGRELFRMSALLQARFDIAEAVQPHLQQLWSRWHETCVFCVYNPAARTAAVVEVVHSPHPLRFAIDVGTELSLPWGSLGRSILAELDEDDREAVLQHCGKAPISGRQITSVAALREELERGRRQGYASYYDEAQDLSGIAAPVFGSRSTVIGCIGIAMPSHRFKDHGAEQMAEAVKHAADELSAVITLNM